MKEFARGCMRTYLILKEKAERWNADPEIQGLVAQINADDGTVTRTSGRYTPERAEGSRASTSTAGRSPRAVSPTSGSTS